MAPSLESSSFSSYADIENFLSAVAGGGAVAGGAGAGGDKKKEGEKAAGDDDKNGEAANDDNLHSPPVSPHLSRHSH